MTDEDWGQVCTCIATNCPRHRPHECDEPPTTRGGICNTCRYAHTPPSKIKEEHRKGANP